ncbi:hypothetical protein ACQ4M3_18970 [Leptolyngbya sp. AN03gr2]|uniref:hypothetical protein n=1 Tax=Leptolyngbya sp. AN03gr2 TaxID=3423364 RepID=UPI003D31FF07
MLFERRLTETPYFLSDETEQFPDVDLQIKEGDLVLNGQDLALNRGSANIVDNLFRRLMTASTEYQRLYRTETGVRLTQDYPFYELKRLLSSRNTQELQTQIQEQVNLIASVDNRIRVLSAQFTEAAPNQVNLMLTYRLIGSDTVRTASYPLS